MTARTLRLMFAAAAAAGVFALTGCGTITISTDDATPSATPSGAAQQPSSAATASGDDGQAASDGLGTDVTTLNPCTLLTPAEVNQFTGREITQIDRDNATAGTTRYCQWQLEQGVLVLSLSPTSADDFAVRDPAAQDFDGVGDEAFTSSGHLYVRSGDLSIDVYSTSKGGDGGSAENIAVEKTVAQRVIDQL
ncbi:DUF3558 family protein [Cryptosporangium arvum]|uniref:DUF3558 family protein n=1 Tax=Cryptosporangium arvum TaxID=80871 RepID=UPI0004AED33D|nr:DUF3558 family protein [Cryptosporangium arvum]